MPERWMPGSWRTKPVLQMPDYPDAQALAAVEQQLATFPPVINAAPGSAQTRAQGEEQAAAALTSL